MPTHPKFSDAQALEMRKKYEAGGTVEGIAKEYVTTGSTVANAVRRVGGTIRTQSYRTKGFNPTVDVELRKKYEAGATLQDLVDEYGTYRSTISNAILRAGGTMRRTGFARGTRSWKKKPVMGILSWLDA